MFKVGDRVRIKETANVLEDKHLLGKEFTITRDDGTGRVQFTLNTPAGDIDAFGPDELEFVQEDNISDWEEDYGTETVNKAFDSLKEDVPSFRLDPSINEAVCETEGWKQKACEDITAIQQAYRDGVADGKRELIESVQKIKESIKDFDAGKGIPLEEAFKPPGSVSQNEREKRPHVPFASLQEAVRGRKHNSGEPFPREFSGEDETPEQIEAMISPEKFINKEVIKYPIIPELIQECLRTSLKQHFADELDDTEIGQHAGQMYKNFLKELEK